MPLYLELTPIGRSLSYCLGYEFLLHDRAWPLTEPQLLLSVEGDRELACMVVQTCALCIGSM